MPSIWRGCRTPRISTFYGSGRWSRPIPHHLRPLSTPASGGAPARGPVASSTRTALALALGGAFLGLGYYVGARSNTVVAGAFPSALQPPLKPVYGTPEEFARAIEELKASFSEDAVTTEPDQLEAHGFSPNFHFPGTPCFAFRV